MHLPILQKDWLAIVFQLPPLLLFGEVVGVDSDGGRLDFVNSLPRDYNGVVPLRLEHQVGSFPGTISLTEVASKHLWRVQLTKRILLPLLLILE